ncbi:putative leucine-rich repeat receptor-like protein kinase [Hibiscus syriacus]|uniref:Leucine-rich repeat receptor-like protein kinase n=1 Tax=Hibiscus syriacus TaxID=106335 RepID=A0A6A2Y5Z6_HIBSY|nr:putative leucine-rich repeat receptor-like protein kinase [Hibiscus syriacus]
MDFKSAADKFNKLASWNPTVDVCTWTGVTCFQNRISRLVLENLDLTGSFESLASLTQLRVLSLKQNRLSGPVPDVSNLNALKLLFLSHNEFTGEFPASVTSLFRLYRLDLSFNNFTGEIPVTINRLTHLLTLRVEENRFSGPVYSFNLPNLQDLNVSGNKLSGEIPQSLSIFPVTAFGSNAALCGAPLEKCKGIESNPTKPGSDGALASPVMPGDVLVLALVSLLLYCYFWRNYVTKMREGKGSKVLEGEKIVYSSSPYPAQPGFERGRMVFFEGVRRFELEDLLRASAEMLGKGGFGTAYKAVLDDGNVLAVKRLKDANVGVKREFEQQMEVLGRLRHPHLVSLKAYYFAREEKLLVYDYMPNGSLFWLLHGNRGPGRTPLDWTTRLKIAAGAASGLAFIHNTCKTLKLTHGNIKSTNVLLDKSGDAHVSDFGLSVFASPTNNAPRSNGYRAPELSTDARKPTQKSDVYSFGVLLLETLTGKCPSVVDNNGGAGYGYSGPVDLPRWVQSVVREEWTAEVFDLELMRYKEIEEEMVGLLQIAMACTSASPDQRPKIGHVVKMIDEIRGVEVSPCHDEAADSVSDSPYLSEATCGAVSQ